MNRPAGSTAPPPSRSSIQAGVAIPAAAMARLARILFEVSMMAVESQPV